MNAHLATLRVCLSKPRPTPTGPLSCEGTAATSLHPPSGPERRAPGTLPQRACRPLAVRGCPSVFTRPHCRQALPSTAGEEALKPCVSVP